MLLFFACSETLIEVKENIVPAKDHSLIENEFNSTVEALTDWVSHQNFYKKNESILPQNIGLHFVDSTFKDLDGVEGTLDFGPQGNSKPLGLLCADGKYRAGKIKFSCNIPLHLPGAKLMLESGPNDRFSSGNGDEMLYLQGVISVENLDGKQVRLLTRNLVTEHNGQTMNWTCNRVLRMISDAGEGIWGDVFSVEGHSSGTTRNGEHYTASITEPLIKKMEAGCSKTFVKGRVNLVDSLLGKIYKINYDPENNQACDRWIETEVNGRKSVFQIQ